MYFYHYYVKNIVQFLITFLLLIIQGYRAWVSLIAPVWLNTSKDCHTVPEMFGSLTWLSKPQTIFESLLIDNINILGLPVFPCVSVSSYCPQLPSCLIVTHSMDTFSFPTNLLCFTGRIWSSNWPKMLLPLAVFPFFTPVISLMASAAKQFITHNWLLVN